MSVYNCEKYLSDSINSILQQTYKDFELIICNDASTDRSEKILFEFQKRYPNKIIVIKNRVNSKLAYSLNQCLKHAKGEYIARMDADDISLPNRLEKQIQFLEKHKEFHLVGTSMIPFDEMGDRSPRIKKKIPTKFDMLKTVCFHHATILIRTKTINSLGGYLDIPRTIRVEDADLWFRFFAKGFKGYNLYEPLYKVRESIFDLNRRTFRTRINAVKTRLFGFHVLKFPWYYYIFVIKPLFVGLIPKEIIYFYHNRKLTINLYKNHLK